MSASSSWRWTGLGPDPEAMGKLIQAAGGAVYRHREPGTEPEFLLVRRPRYDDWTLPKGKLDPGEGFEEAALREVQEETGLRCHTVAPVGTIAYTLRGGRRKSVRYWLMESEGGEFEPTSEVDKISWKFAGAAAQKLSFAKDRRVLARAAELLHEPSSGHIYLLRHAPAGARDDADPGDTRRKLSISGRRHAAKLARRLSQTPIERVISSPYPRCVQTVRPLAQGTGLGLEQDRRLAEGGELEETLALLTELQGSSAVLCTHGDVISDLIDHLADEGIPLDGPLQWRKSSIWELDTLKGSVTAGRYLPPPR